MTDNELKSTSPLQGQFLSVAKEYARQFGEIIGLDLEFWTGIVDGHAALFGDYMVFTLEEMAIVVDGIGKWVRLYGSREAVGQEVRDWFEWVVGDLENQCGVFDPDVREEESASRVEAYHAPVNLYSWLLGLKHEHGKPSARMQHIVKAIKTFREI